jgi:hypothetical protein
VRTAALSIAAFLVLGGPSEGEVEAASVHFAEGKEAFDRGEFALALEHFGAAQELAPHPSTEFHLGRCNEELGRLTRALRHYENVEQAEGISERERATARARRRLVSARLGSLTLEGPAGTKVALDGEPLCTLPCARNVDPGAHELTATLDGEEIRRRVELEPSGRATIRFDPPHTPVSAPPVVDADSEPRAWPTALTWVGIPAVLLGTAGTIGFGLRARDLNADYRAEPVEGTRDRGVRMQTLSNVSVGLLVAGGVLLVADAIWYGVKRNRRGRRQAARR